MSYNWRDVRTTSVHKNKTQVCTKKMVAIPQDKIKQHGVTRTCLLTKQETNKQNSYKKSKQGKCIKTKERTNESKNDFGMAVETGYYLKYQDKTQPYMQA